MSSPFTCATPVSLLSLPYELREQILTSLLCKSGSIKLQYNTECKSDFTPPISQVCRLLRDEAVRVFYQVNTFTVTIDPEAIEPIDPFSCFLANGETSDNEKAHVDLPIFTRPGYLPGIIRNLRHLRIDVVLPDPYSRRLWTETLAKQLSGLLASLTNGRKLKDLRILIATWHRFRELRDWQTEVLGLLEQFSVRGHTQVRTRSLDGKLRASLGKLDLASRLRDISISCTPNVLTECCETAGVDMDWEWEGGVVI